MPIMSFSIPDGMRNLIQSITNRKKFKSQSGMIRAAISSFVNTGECDEIDGEGYTVHGTIMFSYRDNPERRETTMKIAGIETMFQNEITSSTVSRHGINHVTGTIEFTGDVFAFRSFVDEIESINGIEQVRYMIVS